MVTYVLIHGAGDVGWYWHLLEAELRRRRHDVVAPDLPCEDDSAGLAEYADTVIDAIGDRSELVVVAQSFGGFTAPLVCERVPVELMVLLAGMVPSPGERPDDAMAATASPSAARRSWPTAWRRTSPSGRGRAGAVGEGARRPRARSRSTPPRSRAAYSRSVTRGLRSPFGAAPRRGRHVRCGAPSLVENTDDRELSMAYAARIRANAMARRLFGWDFVVTILPAAFLLAIVGMSRPAALAFANNTAEQVGRTLLSLFLVALIFERALEVIIGSWRGPGAIELENEVNALNDALEFLPKETALSPGDRADREKTLVEARSAAVARTVAYRCATKRLALHASFLLGLAVAVAGLRTVEPTVIFPKDVPALQAAALKMLDALLTGGVIAGGSEGIHKIMQVFTDFAQATSKRAKAT